MDTLVTVLAVLFLIILFAPALLLFVGAGEMLADEEKELKYKNADSENSAHTEYDITKVKDDD